MSIFFFLIYFFKEKKKQQQQPDKKNPLQMLGRKEKRERGRQREIVEREINLTNTLSCTDVARGFRSFDVLFASLYILHKYKNHFCWLFASKLNKTAGEREREREKGIQGNTHVDRDRETTPHKQTGNTW